MWAFIDSCLVMGFFLLKCVERLIKQLLAAISYTLAATEEG